MAKQIKITPAGRACGTRCPLYHVRADGEVLGTITNVEGLFRVFLDNKETWFPTMEQASAAALNQVQALRPLTPAAPRGWYDLPVAKRMWERDGRDTEK